MSSKYLFSICSTIGIFAIALPLVGCGYTLVNSRAEAEAAFERGESNERGIHVKQADGSEISLEDLRKQDAEKAAAQKEKTSDQPQAAGAVPAKLSEEGQILKYEEPAVKTPVQLFKIGNDAGASNGGSPTKVQLFKSSHVTEWWTYHWNSGKGKEPGTITVTSSDGKVYGPWQATVVNGVYWKTTPNITLPPGTYTVNDSDPSSWAQNAGTAGQGMTWAVGWEE